MTTCNVLDNRNPEQIVYKECGDSPPTTITPTEPPKGKWASLFREELAQITGRYEAAHRRLTRSQTIEDYADAEEERRDITGEFWAAGDQISDLFLLLCRTCSVYQPDLLRQLFADVLCDELEPLAQAIIKMETRLSRLEARAR